MRYGPVTNGRRGSPNTPATLKSPEKTGVTDGVRTRDSWSHNPALYQLSYGHHEGGAKHTRTARGFKWTAFDVVRPLDARSPKRFD